MAEWRRICCAVDFSDPSRFAMEEAADLARRFQAQLTIVHVAEPPPIVPIDVIVPAERSFETVSVDVARSVAAWRSEAAARAATAVRSAIRIGAPAEEILRFAREEAMDLVVLGTHGRTGLKHLVLGSVAERVVRQAPCPVLVVRTKEASEAAALADQSESEPEPRAWLP
jgi:universal stress protein A